MNILYAKERFSEIDINSLASPFAGRYHIEKSLGKGGMGIVFLVADLSTQNRSALKFLPQKVIDKRPNLAALFQREYHLLKQLNHPHIIEVYDYGVTQEGYYYTMELLEGTDLQQLAPLEWRKACSLLRDIALSLAVLHSRRILHRDITPRNVRYTNDGRAKLLDFGAIATIGASTQLIGTPQYIPPESLHMQPLDQRSDIFVMGALAYWLLTGRHAYPARRVSHLINLWRTQPTPLSQVIPDIPKALNDLILSMINLDIKARPKSASEIINRLGAIAQLEPIEPTESIQACLVNPSLVGRDGEITALRKLVIRAIRANGASVIFEAPQGMGRTRILKHLVIEAKIMGAVAVNCTVSPAASLHNYQVVRWLIAGIVQSVPEIAKEITQKYTLQLANFFPELAEIVEQKELPKPPEDRRQRRNLIHTQLKTWFYHVSDLQKLVLVVDDIHHCDEPSAALIAALGREASKSRILVAASIPQKVGYKAQAAIKALVDSSLRIQLRPLESTETETLFQSMFGNVPHIKLLSDWVYQITRGNPRFCIDIAHHLIDKSYIRFSEGEWILPLDLKKVSIPNSFEETFTLRASRMSSDARELAELLCIWGSQIELTQCLEIVHDKEPSDIFQALNELVAAEVVVAHNDSYTLSHQGLFEVIDKRISMERRRSLHKRIGSYLYQLSSDLSSHSNNDESLIYSWVEAGNHFINGGDIATAIDLYVKVSQKYIHRFTSSSLEVLRSPLFVPSYFEKAISYCEIENYPVKDITWLRAILVIIVATNWDYPLLHHIESLLEQLRNDSGIADAERLDSTLSPQQRIEQGIQIAKNRHFAESDVEYHLSPTDAIELLLLCLSIIIRIASYRLEVELLKKVIKTSEILQPLHPMITIITMVSWSTADRLQGKFGSSNRRKTEIINKLEDPEFNPLLPATLRDRTLAILMQLYGIYQASRGGKQGLYLADEMQNKFCWMQTEACQIRMLTHLYNGDLEEATKCQAQMDIASMDEGRAGDVDSNLIYAHHHLVSIYSITGDLTALQYLIEKLKPLAEKLPGWVPYLASAKAAYKLQRGEVADAISLLENTLQLTLPGEHSVWRNVIVTYIQALVENGEIEKAHHISQQAILDCEKYELGTDIKQQLTAELATIEAKLGMYESAKRRLTETIDEALEEGITGIPLGVLYEYRTRIAIIEGDNSAFIQYANHTASYYRVTNNPSLVIKHEKLIKQAQQAGFEITEDAYGAYEPIGSSPSGKSTLRPLSIDLKRYTNLQKRADRALELILDYSKTSHGFLFLLQNDVLRLVSSDNRKDPPSDLEYMLQYYAHIEGEGREDEAVTVTDEETGTGLCTIWNAQNGDIYQNALLSHIVDNQIAIVGAVSLRVTDDILHMPSWEMLNTIAESLYKLM